MIMADEQSLEQFIQTHTLPSRVKVTEGWCDQTGKVEFSNGDVIDLNRTVCPNIKLEYCNPYCGKQSSISVSTLSPCLFKLFPYIPDRPVFLDKPICVDSVAELVTIWPSVVCARSVYKDENTKIRIKEQDRLKLKRMVRVGRETFLECKIESRPQLIRLSMDCDVGFMLVQDTTAYTLQEIANMPGRIRRRLRLSEDTVNKGNPITGLPDDFSADLFMEPAEWFVEGDDAFSPGDMWVVPIDTDITVSEREDDYTGLIMKWYPFDSFVKANSKLFPVIIKLVEWQEVNAGLEAIRASVGDRLILYRTEDVPKFIGQIGHDYFAIPLTYDATCRIIPRMFRTLEEAQREKAHQVKALQSVSCNEKGLSGIKKGDVLHVMGSTIWFDQKNDRDVATVQTDRGEQRKIPVDLNGLFEEVIDIPDHRKCLSLSQINPTMLPLTVEFPERSIQIGVSRDPLPRNTQITLLFEIMDESILCSKDIVNGKSSPVPIRSPIEVMYVSQYPREKAIPDLSRLASCPEQITEDIKDQMMSLMEAEEDQPQKDVFLAEASGSSSTFPRQIQNRPLPMTPDQDRTLPTKLGPNLHRAFSDPPPRIPPRVAHRNIGISKRGKKKPPASVPKLDPSKAIGRRLPATPGPVPEPRPGKTLPVTHEDEVDALDYEEVGDMVIYGRALVDIFGKDEPPMITIPGHANLSGFSCGEMVVFLQLTTMPAPSLKLFHTNRINGRKFSRLTDEELANYGVNFPLIRHYRNKSKPERPY